MAQNINNKQIYLGVIHKEDIPVEYVGNAEIRWLVNRKTCGADELTVGLTNMKPGGSNPLHRHPNCEEVLHLLNGEVDHYVEGGHKVHLKAGDTILIPRNKKHKAINTGDYTATWIVTFSSADRQTIICEGENENEILIQSS